MWELKAFTTQQVKPNPLDWQFQDYVTQLWSDGIELINAIENVNWGDAALQFFVCGCGIPGCKSDDWVEIRQANSAALIMPAWTKLQETQEEAEYGPPAYLLERGVISVDREIYNRQFCAITPCPDFELLPHLSAWEAVRIFQLEAPKYVLGRTETLPKLIEPDIILASSEGSVIEQTTTLIRLIDHLSQTTHPVNLRRVTESDRVISLYVDIAGYPEWKALSYDGSSYALYLQPGYVIESPA